MCGFAVFIDHKKRFFSDELLSSVDNDLSKRGPDSGGICNEPGFSAVFRRLSIIDLNKASDQPMIDKSQRYVLVFNGCIYNYIELRQEMQNGGIEFFSNGDTEVVFQGLIKYGASFVNKLEGMFSIVFWDKKESKAIVSRDPLGIKPLYYREIDGVTAFSSLIKPLRRLGPISVDIKALRQMLVLRNPIGKTSGIKNINVVLPGQIITYDRNKAILKTDFYFNLKDTFRKKKTKLNKEAEGIVSELIEDSVKKHLTSDVGFSVQLSGGIDSSLVTAIAAQNSSTSIDTFGVKLSEPEYDESYYRSLVVERYKTNHHEIMLGEKEFSDNFDECIETLESPTAHFGCVFLKLLYEKISQNNKVSLVGEGADELFGGYSRFTNIKRNFLKHKLVSKTPEWILGTMRKGRSFERYKKLSPFIESLFQHDVDFLNSLFPEVDIFKNFEHPLIKTWSLEKQQLFSDQTFYLPSLLLRQDKVSMAHSVETRTPFVYHPLYEKINGMDPEMKFNSHETKKILKKIAERWLPKKLIYRKKNGLNLPIAKWLKNKEVFGAHIPSIMDENGISRYADKTKLKNFVEDFMSGKVTDTRMQKSLWVLLSMNSWLKSLKNISCTKVFR